MFLIAVVARDVIRCYKRTKVYVGWGGVGTPSSVKIEEC